MRVSMRGDSEHGITYDDGHPSGKGGSHIATIVGSPGDLDTYSVLAETKPVRCRVSANLLELWQQFEDSVRDGK